MRFWLWILPATAVVVVILAVYTVAAYNAENLPIFSAAFFLNGVLAFPALFLSLGIDQFLIMRRDERTVTRTERILIGALVGLVAVSILASLSEDTSFITVFSWPVLLVVAITTTIALGATNARLARDSAPARDDDSIEDLFPGGEH